MNLRGELERIFVKALTDAGAPAGTPAIVAASARSEFGDYQVNGIMPAAKQLKLNPRQFAQKVVDAAQSPAGELVDKLEIAGPGFINIRLKPEYLGKALSDVASDERLGVSRPSAPQTVVVDYSSPNLAKEMHIGHLRSTIIGDALVRILGFLGHKVIRQNHVGDWGTQFGMLIAYLERQAGEDVATGQKPIEIADLEEFYRSAKKLFDEDAEFAQIARDTVVKLQAGDAHTLKAWRSFVDASLHHCEQAYRVLGVLLTPDDIRGESAYNDDLPSVVADLKSAGLLTESQGAQCVFLDEFKGKDGNPLPIIVQKSDGGYLYATTDLAAVRYRAKILHADRVLIPIDARQSLHLQQVFTLAKKAGFASESMRLEHVVFGTIMGPDGKPFKTREGGVVKLRDVLEEAQEQAFVMVSQKNTELSEERRREVARVVGIAAVKYADLSQNRRSDYVFSWDKMLSMDGNTAPYMQYAYARIRSIFRKSETSAGAAPAGMFAISHPAERTLALKLLQFPEIIATVGEECLPNLLCSYLYDLAGAFMGFYENCPVLQSEGDVRAARLAMCELAARTIRTGLDLLGIQTLEQM